MFRHRGLVSCPPQPQIQNIGGDGGWNGPRHPATVALVPPRSDFHEVDAHRSNDVCEKARDDGPRCSVLACPHDALALPPTLLCPRLPSLPSRCPRSVLTLPSLCPSQCLGGGGCASSWTCRAMSGALPRHTPRDLLFHRGPLSQRTIDSPTPDPSARATGASVSDVLRLVRPQVIMT